MNNIFFISYPRSGSNWLLNIIKELTGESWRGFTGKDTHYDQSLFVKSHCFIRYTGRTLYMYRDPRDVIFSWARALYESAQRSVDYDLGGFNTKWIRDKLKGEGYHHPYSLKDGKLESFNPKVVYYYAQTLAWQIADRWAAHMAFYHNPPEECKVYYVCFETLIRRFKSTMKGILDFCGLKTENYEVPHPLQPRLKVIGKYKESKLWTKGIEKMVEEKIGLTARKYGYMK